MYRPDIVQLRQFYASPLGQMAKNGLIRAIRTRWPQLNNDLMLGIGYANPFLRPYLHEETDDSTLLVPVMPAGQGAVCWPVHTRNRAILASEYTLPYASNIANRILLIHALEHATEVHLMLEECWRVLCPGGRMLIAVPNRRGLWASSSDTPFSYGHPFSAAQLKTAVCGPDRFTHVDTSTSLFFLPSRRRVLRKLAPVVQTIGEFLFPAFGGVILMEVEKQIYAAVKEPKRQPFASPAYAGIGGKPAMTRG